MEKTAKENSSGNSFAYLAIVAIVAIVALVVLVSGRNNDSVTQMISSDYCKQIGESFGLELLEFQENRLIQIDECKIILESKYDQIMLDRGNTVGMTLQDEIGELLPYGNPFRNCRKYGFVAYLDCLSQYI
ncbi:hypothetical protein JW968_04300 [Candidatus Woesearchaeota archaeon]|nr:hypothetical protein [Candidatus Woesearchaeota archaeon]